jgi:hypothetical protein
MTIILPPKNEKGEYLDVSYCSACMICKANGYCYQNQDYDELVMSLEKADRIEIRSDEEGMVSLHRLLHPEETWFPKRRIAFLQDCYARVKGTVVVEDTALVDEVSRLFTNAEIICNMERKREHA